MYSLLRRVITAVAASTFVSFLVLIWARQFHIFAHFAADGDTINSLLFILSAIVGTTGAIAGITIAIVFITLQTSARRQYARTLITLYSAPSSVIVVGFFILTIITGMYQLARLAIIVRAHDYRPIDTELTFGIFSMVFLVPMLMSQVENINPYLLAEKLSHAITPRSVKKYGLVSVQADPDLPTGIRYSLLTFGLYHPIHDPLGPIHEVIMGAVESKDRLQFTRLIRILLRRIAHYNGVYYPRTAHARTTEPPLTVRGRIYSVLVPPRDEITRVAITLHLLHYVVRRSKNLRKEWGDLDNARQHFVVNLSDLIRSLNRRVGTECCIDLCLFAILHVCLGYADLPRFGRIEALTDLFYVATELNVAGKESQAQLTVEILAYLAKKTPQLPRDYRKRPLGALPMELRHVYAHSIRLSSTSSRWRPGNPTIDPWYERD